MSRRRSFLQTVAIGTLGLAGCIGRENEPTEQGSTPSETSEPTTETATPTVADSDPAVDRSLSGNIRITGSSTVFPVAGEVGRRFQEEHSAVAFDISKDGTSGGFEHFFIPGDSDINTASRPITQAEIDACTDNGFEPVEFRIGRDGVTVIVNDENGWIDGNCLTAETLREIWSPNGPETWQAVDADWPDEPFDLYGPASTSGTLDFFTDRINGEAGRIRSDFEGTERDDQIAQGVGGDRYALGYLPLAYYRQETEEVRALGIDDGRGCVEPTIESAEDGTYALSRPLFIYVNGNSLTENEHVRTYVRYFLNTVTSQSLMADGIGYAPLDEETAAAGIDRIEQYS